MSDIIEPKWSKPTVIDGVKCRLAKQLDGEWLVASVSKPVQFCFSAATRIKAIETAKRGIAFWRRSTP